jgi:hypothetical protein
MWTSVAMTRAIYFIPPALFGSVSRNLDPLLACLPQIAKSTSRGTISTLKRAKSKQNPIEIAQH